MSKNQKNVTLLTAGGRITCLQCNAKSKRTKEQCRAPAAKGLTKCRFHCGISIDSKTARNIKHGEIASSIAGNEGRSMKNARSLANARVAMLEEVGFAINLLKGTRTRGRKPKRMNEAYPELQELLRLIKCANTNTERVKTSA